MFHPLSLLLNISKNSPLPSPCLLSSHRTRKTPPLLPALIPLSLACAARPLRVPNPAAAAALLSGALGFIGFIGLILTFPPLSHDSVIRSAYLGLFCPLPAELSLIASRLPFFFPTFSGWCGHLNQPSIAALLQLDRPCWRQASTAPAEVRL